MQLALWTLALALSGASAAPAFNSSVSAAPLSAGAADATKVFLNLAIAPVVASSNGVGDKFVATFDVSLSGADFKSGDVFSVNLPYVALVPGSVAIKGADGTVYASCTGTSGWVDSNDLGYSCVVTDALTASAVVSSTFTFPFYLSAGYGPEEKDLEAAKHWVLGDNAIAWDSFTTTLTLGSHTYSSKLEDDALRFASLISPSGDKVRVVVGGYNCGLKSTMGALKVLTFFEEAQDCTALKVATAKSWNAWGIPTELDTSFTSVTSLCSDGPTTMLTASFTNLPVGERVYIYADYPYVSSGDFRFIAGSSSSCAQSIGTSSYINSYAITNTNVE